MLIQFQAEDLTLFGAASQDVNPFHTSDGFARRTAAGERVVYGALAFLACLGRVLPPAGRMVTGCKIKFSAPVLPRVSYLLTMKASPDDRMLGALMDGSSVTLSFRLDFEPGAAQTATWSGPGIAPLATARPLTDSDMVPGLCYEGNYAPSEDAYGELMRRLGIDRDRWGDLLPVAALCSSYITGMELPGESAMFAELSLRLRTETPALPCRFTTIVDAFDHQYHFLKSRFSMTSATRVLADGAISSVLRPRRSAPEHRPAASDRFQGKTALVVGASRGLGAALALELAAGGATVIGAYAYSEDEAEALKRKAAVLPGKILMEKGDVADLEWCLTLKARFDVEVPGLDLLVCNAALALHPLRLEPACFGRIQAYLSRGFALAAAPLTAFLEVLERRRGTVLLISSIAVETTPKIYPHYVAMKTATEALLMTAANDYTGVTYWIARPGRIQTDLTNTPLGWQEAEPPHIVAGRLLDSLARRVEPGRIHHC